MNEIDHLDIDGRLLRVFLTVIEEGSITAAGARLGLTQSAVSHAMQRLSRIVGRTLFVKSGRGIVATADASVLETKARELVRSLADFARPAASDVADMQFDLTIAANDLQRDLLLPELFQRLSRIARRARIRVIPSDVPSVDLLRGHACDLVITPLPPDGSDVLQRRLFRDQYVCYFDPKMRNAPQDGADYLASRHATVIYPDGGRLQFDKDLERLGVERSIAVMAPSFAGVSAFVRGSDLIATLPHLLAAHVMRDLAVAPVPVEATLSRRVAPLAMYLVWHRRTHDDPGAKFVRNLLIEIGKAAGREGGQIPRRDAGDRDEPPRRGG